jgi:hypothetical protein
VFHTRVSYIYQAHATSHTRRTRAWCHPTSPTHRIGITRDTAIRPCRVCPPARRAATSSEKKPAHSHAQLAENELIAPRVQRLAPTTACTSAGGASSAAAALEQPKQRPARRAAPRGRPAHVGRAASSAGSLWELLVPARVPVQSRAHRTQSRFWRPGGSAISALVRKGLSPSKQRAGRRDSAGENEERGRQGRSAKPKDGQAAEGRFSEQ